MIRIVNNVDEVLDFTWTLGNDPKFASYPKMNERYSVKVELEKAIGTEKQNVIACYIKNQLVGICSYFWIEEEQFAQTTLYLIVRNFDLVAEEFTEYLLQSLPGFKLLIGVPLSNKEANRYFKQHNIQLLESSVVTAFYKSPPLLTSKQEAINIIDCNNFKEYALFHDSFAIPSEMYYHSKNLFKELHNFRIFAYRHNHTYVGSVFAYANAKLSEVFGLFILDEYLNKGIGQELLRTMIVALYEEFSDLKEISFFVEEESEQQLAIALDVGFEIKDHYRCYLLQL